MSEYKVYHNNRCSKSRCAIDYLSGKDIEVVEYMKTAPTKAELKEVLKMLGIPAFDLLRKGETIYKEQFKDKKLTESQWIDAMLKYPQLIERPIVIKNGKAVIARPTERIDELG